MSDFAARREVQLGGLGAGILDAHIRATGWIPYGPQADGAHPFDRLIASPDKRHICIVEVKTKARREAYRDTGINRRHYEDYRHITATYRLPLFLAFVDPKEGRIYGNYWTELLTPRIRGACRYPWHSNGIVYFPLDAMPTLRLLTTTECSALLALRQTRWVQHHGSSFLPKS